MYENWSNKRNNAFVITGNVSVETFFFLKDKLLKFFIFKKSSVIYLFVKYIFSQQEQNHIFFFKKITVKVRKNTK